MSIYVKGSIAFLYFLLPIILISNSIVIDKGTFTYWMDTHWLFNYEHGFIKRGFVGEVFRQFGHGFTLDSLAVAQTYTIIIGAAGFLMLITWFVNNNCRPNESWHNATILAVGLMLITAPGTLRQLIFEIGRFDAFGLAIICAVFVITGNTKSILSFLLLLAAIVLAILVHEALFFWVVPLSLWLWCFRGKERACISLPTVIVCLAAVCAVLIAGTSSYDDYLAFAEIKSDLARNTDVPVVDSSLMVQYRSLDENIARSAKYSFTYLRIIGYLLGIFSLLPYLVVLFIAVRRPDKVKLLFALLAAVSPLFLVLVGHDQGRWLAMANASLCLVMIALLSNVRVAPERAKPLLPFIFITSIFQFYVGPFGNIVPFPLLMQLL